MKPIRYHSAAVSIAVALALSISSTAQAQSGSLRYISVSDFNAQPVPVDSPIALAITALVIAIMGYWVVRSRHKGLQLGLVVALGALGLVSTLQVDEAKARAPSTTIIPLIDPNGDTVPVLESARDFRNDTGTEIVIMSLSSPCSPRPNLVTEDACRIGLKMAAGEFCGTEYSCN